MLYATLRVVWHAAYFAPKEHYLTPFYSPCVTESCVPESRDFGTWLPKFPPLIPYAIIGLVFLLGFRLTCYYYRKAYYRAFWASPPACGGRRAARQVHRRDALPADRAEPAPLLLRRWPAVLSAVNTYDLVNAFRPEGHAFGFGLGTIIMLINVVVLWTYTASCHSCRHIIGGRLRNFSRHPLRYKAWGVVSKLNAKHMQLAWVTLGTLMLTDGYIALVASGAFSDPSIVH